MDQVNSEQNLSSTASLPLRDPQTPVSNVPTMKRKRGRPRKYPLNTTGSENPGNSTKKNEANTKKVITDGSNGLKSNRGDVSRNPLDEKSPPEDTQRSPTQCEKLCSLRQLASLEDSVHILYDIVSCAHVLFVI
eukprot:Rmarinus@m.18530